MAADADICVYGEGEDQAVLSTCCDFPRPSSNATPAITNTSGEGLLRSLSQKLLSVFFARPAMSEKATVKVATPPSSSTMEDVWAVAAATPTSTATGTPVSSPNASGIFESKRNTHLYEKLIKYGILWEAIPGRLVLLTPLGAHNVEIETSKNLVLFTDEMLVYEAFHLDFGPLNLACAHRYCTLVLKHLNENRNALIVHYCSSDPRRRSNAVFLIGAFMVVMLKFTPNKIDEWLRKSRTTLLTFRDATYGGCTFKLSVGDCLKGLHKAVEIGWYDFNTFDLANYETYDRLENGDLHWVIPKEFIAFSGPEESSSVPMHMACYAPLSPREYAQLFKTLGVKLVIRLNKEQYDSNVFLKVGIDHKDLYFLDGSCPPPEILKEFMNLAENYPKPIAVHCKAGLGRTGTLLGCYAMKRYGFTAREWISWNRLMRPGSVLGPQQNYLCEMESELRLQGLSSPVLTPPPLELVSAKLSDQDRFKLKFGDTGQGNRLMDARCSHSPNSSVKNRHIAEECGNNQRKA